VYAAANVLDFDFTTFEKHRAKSALFELGLRLAHRVVVQTDEQRELCVRKLGHSPPVIRSLAEPAPLRVRTPEAFLWAGRVVSYKQPLKYVDLALALPEAQFWMVAVPDDALEEDRALLADLRARAASAPNLRLTPALSRPELLDLMESAVAVVSTSSSEGMPNIWLEGWSRGIPALTLQHDPDSLIEKHGLGQSCRGDMAEFVSAARSLWNGRAHQGELAEVCRAYVAREHSPVAAARKWRQALGI
jgi:glycosyltransferase involved in cell wall biosynthesis